MRIVNLAITLVVPIALVVLAALPNIDHAPSYDEMLHFVAALGYMNHGDIIVAQGEYPRGKLFTVLVATAFEFFGISDVSARLPSIISCALLALILHAFLRSAVHSTAGFVAVALLATAPTFVAVAQTSRFYSLHAFLFLAAAVLVYFAATTTRASIAQRGGLAAVAVALLAVCLHLQATTLIGVAGLLCWGVLLFSPQIYSLVRKHYLAAAAVMLVGAIIGVIAIVWLDLIYLLERFRTTAVWAEARSNSLTFYNGVLRDNFGFGWILSPFLILPALRKHPRITIFALVIFVVGIVAHTLAAQKAARYIVYLLPFLALPLGIGIGELLKSFLQAVAANLRSYGVDERRANTATKAIVAVSLAFVALINPNTSAAIRGLVDPAKSATVGAFSEIANWPEASAEIAPYVGEDRVLITSSGFKALFYIGFYDYELNLSVVAETDTEEEFGTDDRTGARAIGTLGSLSRVMRCNRAGTIIADRSKWRTRSHITLDVADYIEAQLTPIPLPANAKLLAYSWSTEGPIDPNCQSLPATRAVMLPKNHLGSQ